MGFGTLGEPCDDRSHRRGVSVAPQRDPRLQPGNGQPASCPPRARLFRTVRTGGTHSPQWPFLSGFLPSTASPRLGRGAARDRASVPRVPGHVPLRGHTPRAPPELEGLAGPPVGAVVRPPARTGSRLSWGHTRAHRSARCPLHVSSSVAAPFDPPAGSDVGGPVPPPPGPHSLLLVVSTAAAPAGVRGTPGGQRGVSPTLVPVGRPCPFSGDASVQTPYPCRPRVPSIRSALRLADERLRPGAELPYQTHDRQQPAPRVRAVLWFPGEAAGGTRVPSR